MNNGRKEIFTDLIPNGDIEHDKTIIPTILDNALSEHTNNKTDESFLIDYYYNQTDIQNKKKVQQTNINNKIGIPYANIAVTTINSYCFSRPFTRNSRSSDNNVALKLKAFNDALDDDDYDGKTAQAEFFAGSCGLGYKFIRPATPEELEQGIWFKTFGDLNPLQTFIVKSNNIDKEKVLACNYFDRKKYEADGTTFKQQTIYNVYTKYHYWKLIKDDNSDGYEIELQPFENKLVEAYPLVYKKIPIIEYPRKQDRTCDFEIGIPLIDAINNLASSRVDDVQQAVDYILLLRDIATDEEDIKNITKAVAKGILAFRSIENTTVQPEVKVLNTQIHQNEVQTLQDFLCHKVEEALNIPNRETRGSSGDTGLAVESRAGYRSLENIAGLITICAKKAENEALDVILAICEKTPNCPIAGLKIRDIELKDNRNKLENVNNASTAYSTLRSAGMNDQDALAVTQIVPDSLGTAERNRKEVEENQQRQLELQKQQVAISTATQDSNNETDKSAERK